MLSPTQLNGVFQNEYGRVATPQEYEQYKNAPLSTIANLSPAQISNTNPNITSQTSPYDVPVVQGAAQNVATVGSAITAGNQELNDIYNTRTGNTSVGITTANQLNQDIRSSQAPILSDLKTLGQQYNAARSTYSTTLSAAKAAISSAKSTANKDQSVALNQASKIISLIKSGQIDPNKTDFSGIEQASGLPKGFFASIKPVTKSDTLKSLKGGLYDVSTNKWIVSPTPKTTKATKTSSASSPSVDMTSYLANQGLPLSVATTSGKITKTALDRVLSAGVPLNVANGIWSNMENGNTFEEIRQGIAAQGQDPSVLDKFVQALQGSTTIPISF